MGRTYMTTKDIKLLDDMGRTYMTPKDIKLLDDMTTKYIKLLVVEHI